MSIKHPDSGSWYTYIRCSFPEILHHFSGRIYQISMDRSYSDVQVTSTKTHPPGGPHCVARARAPRGQRVRPVPCTPSGNQPWASLELGSTKVTCLGSDRAIGETGPCVATLVWSRKTTEAVDTFDVKCVSLSMFSLRRRWREMSLKCLTVTVCVDVLSFKEIFLIQTTY